MATARRVTDQPDVTVVLPARNEAGTIAQVIRRLSAVLHDRAWTHEIVVGDSASTDDTAARAKAAGPRVRVVREERPGKGRILTRCFQASRGRVLAFMDSDLDLAPEELPWLIDAVLGGAACAAGAKDGPALASRPWLRRSGSLVVNGAARLLLRTGLTDHQTGMKAFDGATLRAVLPRVKEHGWLWDTEVIWRILQEGGRVVQVPVQLAPGRTDTFRSWEGGWTGARDVMTLYGRLAREPRLAGTPLARRDAVLPGS